MKFKVGDKVVIVSKAYGYSWYRGQTFTLKEQHPRIWLFYEESFSNAWESDLEPATYIPLL